MLVLGKEQGRDRRHKRKGPEHERVVVGEPPVGSHAQVWVHAVVLHASAGVPHAEGPEQDEEPGDRIYLCRLGQKGIESVRLGSLYKLLASCMQQVPLQTFWAHSLEQLGRVEGPYKPLVRWILLEPLLGVLANNRNRRAVSDLVEESALECEEWEFLQFA